MIMGRMNKYNTIKNGFAALPTIMALMVLIFLVSGGITIWSLSETFSTQSQINSNLALAYAEEGARDALTRIARKYNYNCPGSDCYSIDMVTDGCSNNEGCARITVSAGTGGTGDPKIITSKGQVKSNIRRIQVDVSISSDGEITNAAWQELTN